MNPGSRVFGLAFNASIRSQRLGWHSVLKARPAPRKQARVQRPRIWVKRRAEPGGLPIGLDGYVGRHQEIARDIAIPVPDLFVEQASFELIEDVLIGSERGAEQADELTLLLGGLNTQPASANT